ncbi:TetR/AcrR family transcriptional regulator [Algisphaera agarilytica]|uniref:TetR/AcrR family transcriptional repressor of nem operon n=1 Tax=Algisphaera agarilytica TaxID=1385975 RepID=A0A7X0LK15_9BACT|nr:TetR/AcrR family transcriptional regulator [Algisphaera agarilytica]MBB6429166.1 TetR/AcrR family transcriptional repressor of nem operon [Algisphaera agarilytica]
MPYPAEHKLETRERILRAAARQFREKGFAAASLSAIMKEAGLTHGGFYAHFENKDALVAEVIRSGFDHVSEKFESQFAQLDGEDWLHAWVRGYLGDAHLSHADQGCPLPTMSSEIARIGEQAVAAFTTLFYERLAHTSSMVQAPPEEARRRVLAAFSQMVGGLMLARAVEPELAREILESVEAQAIETLCPQTHDTPATKAVRTGQL